MGGTFQDFPIQGGGGGGGGISAVLIGNLDSNGSSSAGATVTGGNTVVLESANATTPGLVNSASQTFAGVKTFSTAPIFSSLPSNQVMTTGSSGNQSGTLVYASVNTNNSLAFRDANGNSTFNNVMSTATTVPSVPGNSPAVLTAGSGRVQRVTGSQGFAFTLPDATTLIAGTTYEFDNNNTAAAITINKHDGSTLVTNVAQGGYAYITCVDNSTTNGQWDWHFLLPSNISASGWGNSTGGAGPFQIGTLDGATTGSASANGAVMNSTSIYMQSASAVAPGLVALANQTMGSGDKTFPANIFTTTDSTYNVGTMSAAFKDSVFSNSVCAGSIGSGNMYALLHRNLGSGVGGTLRLGQRTGSGPAWIQIFNDGVELKGNDSSGNTLFQFLPGSSAVFQFYQGGSQVLGQLNSAAFTMNVGRGAIMPQATIGSVTFTSSANSTAYTFPIPGVTSTSASSVYVNNGIGGAYWSITNGITVQTFSSGSGIYTPTVGAIAIKVTLVGGGGGGGGCLGTVGSNTSAGGGGGGGGLAIKWITNIAASYPYYVADGGAGGVAGQNNGSSGSSSTFGSAGAIAVAGGGGGGQGSGAATVVAFSCGGAAGVGILGDITMHGSDGGFSILGQAVTNQTQVVAGAGGGSFFTGFRYVQAALQTTGAAAGLAGYTGGGGGGGAMTVGSGSLAQAGGKGGSGVITIEEFFY